MNENRILIVDDHGLFREGLGRLLDSTADCHVVGQCSTIREAMTVLAKTDVDVILLDYDLGDETGTNLFVELRRIEPVPKVLMVTAGLTDLAMRQALERGAAGIFLKHSSPEQLLLAIRQVLRGETWLDKGSLRSLIDGKAARTSRSEDGQSLTQRQSEVLRGILDGFANKEIAWSLQSSESAVKAVIQELFRKAGVRTRSQLVRIAIENHSHDWLTTEQNRR
jgi:DNA-binding NarL/FixJ family response regulator